MLTRKTSRHTPISNNLRFVAPLVAMMAIGAAADARGQVVPGGFQGGYGWGGWGTDSSVGSAFRGMGAFAAGLGAGDLQSAQADAIRTQSFLELNEYLYQSSRMYRAQAAAARRAERERSADARDELRERKLNEPTPSEIESGEALNNLLFELDNPGIPDSVVRDSADGMSIPGAAIQKIPFRFAHRGIAISIDRLSSNDEGWPAALRDPEFEPLRDRYNATIKEILAVDDGESVPNELVDDARSVLREMYQTVQQSGLEGQDAVKATQHLKDLAGMVTMLRENDVKQVLDEAGNVDQVALPTLMNFMRVFNLNFGAPETIEEKALYSQELYPKFAQLHDSLLQQYDGQLPGSVETEGDAPVGRPGAAFDDFDLDQLGLSPDEISNENESEQPDSGDTLDPSN